MARCIANIAYNLCDKSQSSEKDKKTQDTLLHGVATEVVPLLLTFWQLEDKETDDKAKKRCVVPHRKETDKQIVQLLALLYSSAKYKLAPKNIELIKKRLDMIYGMDGYEKQYESLAKVYATV